MTREHDCLVIGGGPAGLTAALYLARFRRRVIVIDAGASRAAWIPVSHNLPGFPDGLAGRVLLTRLRAQLAPYRVPVRRATVDDLRARAEGGFAARSTLGTTRARAVIVATGVIDAQPELADLWAAVRAGHVRSCPICDAWEARGQAIGVIGRGRGGLGEARFLAPYARRLALFTLDRPLALEAGERAELAAAGITPVAEPVEAVDAAPGRRPAIRVRGGRVHRVDTLYSALGTLARAGPAAAVGAALDRDGRVRTDAHQRSSVAGVYAAGDVVPGLNQVAVALAQGAVAATALHNWLRGR